MEEQQSNISNFHNERLQNILQSFSKCKIEYINEKEECNKLREVNNKLELELKEAREQEKSHRCHLQTSREMIGNLQETISQLVYLKRDVKKLTEEITLKEAAYTALQKDKDKSTETHNRGLQELRMSYEQQIEEIKTANESKLQQVQSEADTQIAQFTCLIEELKSKLREMDTEHREKMNVLVLEYEEELQRRTSQVTQLQEQLAKQNATADMNIDAYRRKLEDMEEKLKQSQFKEYFAKTSCSTQYDRKVECPYSLKKNPYSNASSLDLTPVLQSHTATERRITNQNKNYGTTSSLQIMYDSNTTPKPLYNTQKKGEFKITKKRKLYNEKEFLNF